MTYNWYEPGAKLGMHLDEHHEETKGVRGWLRPSRRSVTWLVYLNGGILRCFPRNFHVTKNNLPPATCDDESGVPSSSSSSSCSSSAIGSEYSEDGDEDESHGDDGENSNDIAATTTTTTTTLLPPTPSSPSWAKAPQSKDSMRTKCDSMVDDDDDDDHGLSDP